MRKAPAIPLTARRTDIYMPESLEGTPKAIEFQIRIPTPSERDEIGTRLYELGLAPVTEELMRAAMIDELYKIDWSVDGGGADMTPDERTAYNEETAEEKAQFLDTYWQNQMIESVSVDLWREQEAQRLIDEAAGAPKRDPLPMPAKITSIRDHSKAALLVDDFGRRSERIRKLSGEKMSYGRRSQVMAARVQLMSMKAVDADAFAKVDGAADITLERDDTGLITIAAIDRLREFIGNTAWRELYARVDAHFSLSETERKNSESPLEKQSDQTGSHEPSGDLETSAGASTT